MQKLTLTCPFDRRTLSGGAAFADRYLNFVIEHDGLAYRQDGPNIALLAWLDRFVWASLETELSPFRVRGEMYSKLVRERDENGQLRTVSSPTYATAAFPNPSFPGSYRLVTLLALINDWLASHPAAKNLLPPPHLRLLFDVFFDHPISRCKTRDLNAFADDTGRTVAEGCNDFVDRLRQAMLVSKPLRRELHNWYLGSQENVTNLHAYLDALFTRHPSLTALHLRLHAPAPAGDQHHGLRALRDCRTKLFERMRKNPALFTSKPGYVWAILPSLDGRYDLHLTLLFDTAALRKLLDDKRVEADLADAVLKDHADLVGEYWVDDVTGGQGRYFRADRERMLYGSDWVHGEVGADDMARRGKLVETLGYLALRRVLVRLKSEPPGPYFGMAEREPRGERRPPKGGRTGPESCLEARASR